jgi:hypothetical protein
VAQSRWTGGGELRLVDANSQISVFTGGSTLTNLDNLIHGGNVLSSPSRLPTKGYHPRR